MKDLKIMSESDSDGVPELVDSSDDETTETSETENTNEIYAKTWLDKNVKFHERQELNLRVFSLGAFLFGVNTFIPKPWMCAMLDAGLLLNAQRETEITVLDWTEWALVDLVEQVVLVMLKKLRKKSYLVNCLDFIKEVETLQQKEEKIDVDTAIDKAGEFMHVKKIWTRSLKTSPCKQKERETKFAVLYVAKLYHILILGIGRDSKDVAEEMKKALKDKTGIALKYKDDGNGEYGKGHYEAATDYYTQAAKADPLNHIYYGNRSQAYSRQKKFKEALADGRRASTLEPNWMKGLYRYAQAFAELDKLDMAIAINERGLRICERPGHKKDESYFSEIKGQGKKLYREREMRNIRRVLENKDYANKFLEEELPAELRNLPGKKRVIKLSEALSGLTEKPSTAVEEIPDSDISEGSSDEEPMCEPLSKPPPEIEQEIAPPKEIIQEVALESRTEMIKDKDKASELRHLLSDGTMALTKDLGKEAVTSYNRALELTINFDMKTLDIEEADLVVLKYAFGIAAVSTGMFKNIMDGIQKFTEITKEHHDFKFPLAYYGLGKAFITLNRFTEALPPLEKGLSMVEKSGTNMISWPGSDKKIEESNGSKLRALMKELIRIGKLPPKPDAVCRYHCDEDDGRTVIYFSDPDFKGFVRILCRAQCCIEFHNNCWRIFKTRFDKTTDKDILDKPCPTPDCGTTIVKICIFRQDALLKEMESERVESKPVPKSKKPAEKLPPSSAYKIQRKQDRKLLRQQKKKEISEEMKDLKLDVTEIIEESLKSPPEKKQDPPTASGGGDSSQKEDSEADCAPLDHTKPVAVLRKDEEEKKLNKYKGTKKQKQKKKKEKTVKQVINVEVNFTGEREKYLQNEFDAPDEDAVTEQARNKYGDSNFSVPPDLHDRVQAFEKVYTPPEQPQFDDITNNLFSFFGDLLEAHGPLHVEDTRITSMVEDFPEDAKAKIEDCGGLSKFLQQSLKFAMIDDILCLLKDAVKAREISKARNSAWQTLKTNERDSVKSNTAIVYPQKPHKNPWKTVTKNQYSEKNSVYTDKVEFPSLLNSVSNESEPSFPVVQKEKPLYNKSYEMDNWDNVRSNKKSTVDTLDDFDDVVAKKGSMSALDDDFDLPPRKGGTKMDCIDMIDDIPLPAVNRKKSKKVKHIDDLDSIDSYSGSESESNQEGSIMSDRDSLSSEFSSSRSVQGKEKFQVNNRIHAGDWKGSDIKQDPPSVSRSSSKSDLSEKSGCELSSDLIAKSYMTMEPHRSPLASPSPVALTKEQSISAGSKFGPIGSPLTVENNRVEKNSSGQVPQPLKIPSFNKKPPSTLQEEAELAAAQEIYRNDSQLVNEIASKVMDQIYSGQSVPAAERMETFNRVKKDIWSDFNRDKQGGIHNSPGNANSLGMSFGQIPGHQNSKDDFTEQFMKKHYQQNMTDPLGQMKSPGEILPPRHIPLSTGYTNSPKTNVSSNLGFPSFHTPSENFPTPLSYPRSSAPLADVKFPDVIAVTSSIWTANVDNGLQSNHSFPRENYFHSFPSSNQPPSYKSDLFGSLSIGTSVVQSDKSFPSFSSPSNTDRIYGISLSRVNQCIQVSFETKCVETMTDPYEPYKLEYFQAKETQERLKSDLNAATSQIEELASLLQQSDRKGKEMEMEIQHQRQILEKQQSLMDEKAMLFGQELQRLTQELQKKEAVELELRQSLNAADQKCLDLQKQQNDERQINIQLQVEKTDALRNKEEFRKIMENETLRAQKSEIEELNTRQKYSIQMLEKSQKESFLYKQHLMGIIKKMEEDKMQVPQQLRDTVDKYNFIAVKCEETIKRLKSEFEEQIKQIREGKKLSDLKDIFIPPPPPPPPLQFPQLMKDQQAQHHGPSTTPMNMAHLQGGVTSLADSAMSKLPPSVSNPATSQIATSVASTPVQPKPLGLPPGVQKPKPLVPPAGLASMQPRPMGGVNLHAMMNPATVGNRPQAPYKNSFEKLVQKLTLQFPNYNRAVFTQLIQEVRASRGGSLSGMTLDEIIHYIKETISKYEKSGFPVPGASPKQEKSSQISSQASSLSDFGIPLKKSVGTPAPSGGWHLPGHNFPSVSSLDIGMSQSEVFEEEEDPCVICHEEMTPVTTVRLECKHMFHDECIRKWLREQSTCPTCRIYALLPDEFPSLK